MSFANLHLETLITNLCSGSRLNSCRRCCSCDLASLLATRISSMYTKVASRPWQTVSISRWNACAAFFSPNGIRRNSNRPNGVITAVFGMSSAATGGSGGNL